MELIIAIIIIAAFIIGVVNNSKFKKREAEVLEKARLTGWYDVPYYDEQVVVKSRSTLEKYDAARFFKENREKLDKAEMIIERKNFIEKSLRESLIIIEPKNFFEYVNKNYRKLKKHVDSGIIKSQAYRIEVKYITSAGNHLASKEIELNKGEIKRFIQEPFLLMTKGEYSKYIKEQNKIALDKKHHEYYERVNYIIDYVNDCKASLIKKEDCYELDNLMAQLFDRTINSIKKIKTLDSEEWDIIGDFIDRIKNNVEQIVNNNQKILDYYKSPDFLKVKDACETLMSSQRDFNEYIEEKVQSISKFFGSGVTRNETVYNDVNNYFRPYKKTITPFTAEVSSTVYANAENHPLEYVIKYFYPNKKSYPEQIQKLYLLVEELETLKDAKQIIDNYKAEYQQYLGDVPSFIIENDEAGFYSRLGFANLEESALTVEYKFSYTSPGGYAQRSFTFSMDEVHISQLIAALENKLTYKEFAKEQRRLMTKKLRESIKIRDNYTCCNCHNSIQKEPNLLLEIDHIIPISKGGCTTEDNLQTLCWKCNRSKSDKIIY